MNSKFNIESWSIAYTRLTCNICWVVSRECFVEIDTEFAKRVEQKLLAKFGVASPACAVNFNPISPRKARGDSQKFHCLNKRSGTPVLASAISTSIAINHEIMYGAMVLSLIRKSWRKFQEGDTSPSNIFLAKSFTSHCSTMSVAPSLIETRLHLHCFKMPRLIQRLRTKLIFTDYFHKARHELHGFGDSSDVQYVETASSLYYFRVLDSCFCVAYDAFFSVSPPISFPAGETRAWHHPHL